MTDPRLTQATFPVDELIEPKDGELPISHHGSFLKAEERRIQYERVSRDRGERREYATRLDGLDPERRRGYVVVEMR